MVLDFCHIYLHSTQIQKIQTSTFTMYVRISLLPYLINRLLRLMMSPQSLSLPIGSIRPLPHWRQPTRISPILPALNSSLNQARLMEVSIF